MSEKKKQKELQIVGRREIVDFPELGLMGIEAKVDTGAFTTALHCHDIRLDSSGEVPLLYFKVLDPQHPEYNEQEHCFSQFRMKNIKNSFGDYESRYIIQTLVKIGRRKIKTTVSLADRANMRYPVLIGRKFLGRKFLVDVSKIHVVKNKKA